MEFRDEGDFDLAPRCLGWAGRPAEGGGLGAAPPAAKLKFDENRGWVILLVGACDFDGMSSIRWPGSALSLVGEVVEGDKLRGIGAPFLCNDVLPCLKSTGGMMTIELLKEIDQNHD